MPLLDVQRQHATMFRLRFGDQVEASNGKMKPQRLTEAIRVTSPNAMIVDAFCRVYDGDRTSWNNQGKPEFEAYLPTKEIRVVLLPGSSISQWWELYKGSVCERRCDSVTETKSGKPCMCPATDPQVRNRTRGQCSATTRVNVICPDVDVVGAGMFTTHGLMAAAQLPNAVAAADAALAAGIYVPAVVRIVEYVGDGTRWVVPQIEVVGASLETLMATAIEARQAGELDGAAPKILGWDPPKPLEAGTAERAPVGSVREQMAAANVPPAPSTRSNAQTPIPPSGLAPRPADDSEPVDGELVDPPHERETNRVAIACREAGLDDDGRHALVEWATRGRTSSSKTLSDAEHARALDTAAKIRDGELRITEDGQIVDNTFGFAQSPPATPPPEPARDAPFTLEQILKMTGPELQAALRTAGLPLGGKVDELKDRLAGHYGVGEEAF